MKISPTTMANGAVGLGAEITGNINNEVKNDDVFQAQIEKQAKERETALASSKKTLMERIGLSKGQNELTSDAYSQKNELGTTVNETSKKLRDTNAKINAIDIRTNEQLKAIESAGGTTLAQSGNQIRAIQRQASTDKADLYIDKLMAQGDYDTAKSIADRKIDVILEQDRIDLEKLKFDYEENKDLYTKAEQRQFETMQADRERKLDDEKKRLTRLEDTKIALLKSASEQGASNQIRQAIQSSKTPEEAIMAAGVYGGDILERNIKQKQLDNIQSEIDKRNRENKPVFLDPEGRIIVDRTEAQKVSKELVNNDAYKAIQKSKDSLAYLKNFEEALDKYGSTSGVFDPIKNAELKAKYNAATLQLKEFFNLGVLNGPDLSIIQGVLPNPSDTSNFRKFVQLGTYQPATASQSGLNSMKKMVETALDDRYKSIRTQYSPYSPQSVAGLADANRIYIEQKSILNPNIQQLVDENPDLSDEEILTIMGI